MNIPLLTLTVSSPEELTKTLSDIQKKSPGQYRFISLALFDPKLLVYPFSFENISFNELKLKIMSECVGLLSMPVREIEIDFQILSHQHNQFRGIFICMPRLLINKYLQVIYKANLVPIKITAAILANIDSFLTEHRKTKERLCIIDFCKKNTVHLSIFQEGRSELLREIHYENHNEISHEILQSLRSVYGKSSDKNVGKVYGWGYTEDNKDILQKLDTDLLLKVDTTLPPNRESGLKNADSFFSLNLVRNYTVSLKKRQKIITGMRVVIALVIVACIFSYFQIAKFHQERKNISSSYTKAELEEAKRLQQKMKAMGI
jgi:hypothetical protein